MNRTKFKDHKLANLSIWSKESLFEIKKLPENFRLKLIDNYSIK